jgi:hypothetical protein
MKMRTPINVRMGAVAMLGIAEKIGYRNTCNGQLPSHFPSQKNSHEKRA